MAEDADLTHEAVLADVRTFVDVLEATHPAPFVGAGGRFAYYERVQSALDDVPSDGWPERGLQETVASLAAAVRDAHMFVVWPTADGTIPLRLGVVDGEIRVRSVREGVPESLVGSRLRRVDGVPVGELIERQARLRGSETPHGDLLNLALSLRNWRAMAPLLDRAERPDEATFAFEASDGTTRREPLEPTTGDGAERVAPSTLERPDSEAWPTYQLLPERDAAWLRIPSMSDHREAFQYRQGDLDEHARASARSLCRAATGEPDPDDFDEVLDKVPAALDLFRDLADEMATAGTSTLLVDLRDNTGGNRVLVDLLAYVLYGWDGVATARDRPGALRYSDRLVERRGTEPFEDEGREWSLRPGEYAIGGGDSTVEEIRDDLVESVPTFERLEAPDWPSAGSYAPPAVVVVTAARTFSAGVSLLATLRRLGASHVGTPPVQAPTYFGDLVSFTLPNSEITAMTATSRIETLPDGPGDVLEPDRRLTGEDFARYDFDRDASVLLALDEYC
ncbi:hypothetical protein I7X12_20015 [Halosimplex litoreum]|uniref:Peptidase family S41 n=1 Tax=Halosimplex litoreum TaxID=1198301 RepID=A0A7T3FYD8_9EURY|nr:hypothetical protein [Halosimplex litoreum]QPV62966.1 hypothetical protein I7X12_20015 [Halosimplex litoreum]